MIIARGQTGRLLAGHRVAAVLGEWALNAPESMAGDGFFCDAAVRRRDEFWLEHGASFVLEVEVGANTWRWRGVEVALGERLNVKATGKPEVTT